MDAIPKDTNPAGHVRRSNPDANGRVRTQLPSHAPRRRTNTSQREVQCSVRVSSSEEGSEEETPIGDREHGNAPATTTHPCMDPREAKLWAMSFEELYQHARSRRYWGTTGTPRRKTGRIRTIKSLCENEGIVPFIAPIVAPSVEASPVITRFTVRPTGAISHPEANLCASDPELQKFIDVKAAEYFQWPNPELLTLAMQRSYQLLKDSNGKLPSRSNTSLSRWLAAWDVLKSPREKNWWLGDGIDLVNKAKALGYQGRSTKYEVIVWLRTTAEEVDVEVKEVKEPTPNKKPKRADGVAKEVSKRPAKGSKRPNGWHDPNP